MQVTTYNQKGEAVGNIELPKDLFEVKMSPDLVYQVATTQMNNRRQGTAHTKGRGEVSGGGKKPWKQKGTGRSRQGSIRSPQWRHGGVVFGPTNEKVYGGKINKKMRRKALAMVLSAKASGNMLVMMDDFAIAQPKTKDVARILDSIRVNNAAFGKGTLMIALPGYEKNAILAARNIPGVRTTEAAKLNVLDLLNTKYLLMPVQSLETIICMDGTRSRKETPETEAIKEKKSMRAARVRSGNAKNKK